MKGFTRSNHLNRNQLKYLRYKGCTVSFDDLLLFPAWKRIQAHLRDARVSLEESRHPYGVFLLALHAEMHCLHTSQEKPRVERAKPCPLSVLEEVDLRYVRDRGRDEGKHRRKRHAKRPGKDGLVSGSKIQLRVASHQAFASMDRRAFSS